MRTFKLTLLSLSLALTAFAQTIVTKEGVGEAAVVNKNETKAFEDAREAALRNAVEQAAGVRIEADTVVVNNQLVRDQVFAKTSGYVKKYDVLDKKLDKGVVTVKVKADVITDALDKDIVAAQDLVKRMGRPSLVIVVQEQTIPLGQKAIINSETLSTVLTEALKADGWDIKDAQAMNKKLKVEGAATLGATDLKEISDLSKAAYVLYGKAVLRHQDGNDGMTKGVAFYPISGEYDLALAATDSEDQITKLNGKLLTSPTSQRLISYERTSFDTIRDRKDEIVAPVRKAILEHFRDQVMNGRKISLVLSGVADFAEVEDFEEALGAIKGAKNVTQDTFANGKAAFRMNYQGSSKDLARELRTSTIKKRKITIVSQSGNTLEVALAK